MDAVKARRELVFIAICAACAPAADGAAERQ
jgi:hypothetical protein